MPIDDVFTRLTLAYGLKFTRNWPENQLPTVKAAWSLELRGISPQAIEYGLAHLPPGNPPMAPDFRDICEKYHEPGQFARAQRDMTKEEQARAVSLLHAFQRPGSQGPRDWAYRLKARELGGEHLSRFQRQCWREALGESAPSPKESET